MHSSYSNFAPVFLLLYMFEGNRYDQGIVCLWVKNSFDNPYEAKMKFFVLSTLQLLTNLKKQLSPLFLKDKRARKSKSM